jgi:hypothetical protein
LVMRKMCLLVHPPYSTLEYEFSTARAPVSCIALPSRVALGANGHLGRALQMTPLFAPEEPHGNRQSN